MSDATFYTLITVKVVAWSLLLVSRVMRFRKKWSRTP